MTINFLFFFSINFATITNYFCVSEVSKHHQTVLRNSVALYIIWRKWIKSHTHRNTRRLFIYLTYKNLISTLIVVSHLSTHTTVVVDHSPAIKSNRLVKPCIAKGLVSTTKNGTFEVDIRNNVSKVVSPKKVLLFKIN